MSPRADRGLCSRTASGGWKEEELGEWGTVLSISGNREETRRGSAVDEGCQLAPLSSLQLGVFTRDIPRLSGTAAQLHPGLGEGGESP